MAFVWGHRGWDGICKLYLRLGNLFTLRCCEPHGPPNPIYIPIVTEISLVCHCSKDKSLHHIKP